MSVAPELQKDVLNNLFGRGGLLQNPQDQGIDHARVAVVQGLEGARIFLDKPLHQRRIRRLLVRPELSENSEEQGT